MYIFIYETSMYQVYIIDVNTINFDDTIFKIKYLGYETTPPIPPPYYFRNRRIWPNHTFNKNIVRVGKTKKKKIKIIITQQKQNKK